MIFIDDGDVKINKYINREGLVLKDEIIIKKLKNLNIFINYGYDNYNLIKLLRMTSIESKI